MRVFRQMPQASVNFAHRRQSPPLSLDRSSSTSSYTQMTNSGLATQVATQLVNQVGQTRDLGFEPFQFVAEFPTVKPQLLD